jgi:transposase
MLPFYRLLDSILEQIDFGEKVRESCKPYYTIRSPGYPGGDTDVYFRLLIPGFCEGIYSERGIALRCADSLGIRNFLGYGHLEEPPCHATLSNEGLLKGVHLGIDSSVIDANASPRELRHKLSGKKYRAYVKQLAAEDGIYPGD